MRSVLLPVEIRKEEEYNGGGMRKKNEATPSRSTEHGSLESDFK
jgi:hypothetical protein